MFRIRLSKEHIKELNNKKAVVFDTGTQIVEIKADFPIVSSNIEVASDARLIDEIDRLRRKVDVLTRKYIEILDENIGTPQGHLLPEMGHLLPDVIETGDKIRLQWGIGLIHDKEERGGVKFYYTYGRLMGIDIPKDLLKEKKDDIIRD